MRPPDPASARLDRLALLSPRAAEGLRRIRDITDTDGALPASLKALCMAGGAAVKRQADVQARELRRAATLGLPATHAWGAALALLISRGEAVCEGFVAAVRSVYGADPGPPSDGGGTPTVTAATARAYFARALGQVPPYVELLAAGAPRALEGYALMREAALAENALPPRDVELFYITVNAVEYLSWNVGLHASGARKAGAGEQELVEAGLCAVPIAGAPAWIAAAEGIGRWAGK